MPSSSCAHRDMHRGVCLDCGMYEAGGVTGRGATRDPHRDGCVHDPVWACEPCLTARAAGRGTTFSDLGCDCGQPNNSGKHTADGCTPQEPGRVPTCEMAHPPEWADPPEHFLRCDEENPQTCPACHAASGCDRTSGRSASTSTAAISLGSVLTNESLARLAYATFERRVMEQAAEGDDRVVAGADFDAVDLGETLGVIAGSVASRLEGLAADAVREDVELEALLWLEARLHGLPGSVRDNAVLLCCALGLLRQPRADRE